MRMKPLFFLTVVIALFSLNLPAAETAKLPALDDAKKVEIKEKQIQLAETMLQMNNLKSQFDQLQKQQQQISSDINGLLVKAQETLDKDKKVCVLNPRTLDCEKVEQPAAKK